MALPHPIQRTRTDEERIEQLAEADGSGAHVIDLSVGIRPWLAGTVTSAVQVQALDDRPPAEAMERGGIVDAGREHAGGEKHEYDPE